MQTLAVVPIFMSAGAAALPTIVAATSSVVAIALKPRELLRLCRRRPLAVAGVVGSAVLMVALLSLWLRTTPAARAGVAEATRPRFDWAAVARAILEEQADGKSPTTMASVAVPTHAVFEGIDGSRSSFGGGVAPDHLKRKWTFKPEDASFLSQPMVFGSRVFVAACQSDVGGYTGLLACVDGETGQPIWQTSALGDDPLKPFFSTPAITADGKRLIVGQGFHEDHDCALLCFDASNGHVIWSVKTPLHIESSPVISGDIAIVGCGAIEGKDGKPTGDPGYALAVRISDGQRLWSSPVNDPESSPVADTEGVVFIGSGFNGSAVVALRSGTDEELAQQPRLKWRRDLPYPMTGPITLAGDTVFAGGGNSDVVHSNADPHGVVVALDRKSGAVLWQTPFADAVLGDLGIASGKIICPVRTGEVAALSVKDGQVLWHTRISGNAPIVAGCTVTAKRIYAVSTDGYLGVLDADTGAVLEKIYLNDAQKPGTGLCVSPPQLVDGRLVVGSETGGLQCFTGGSAQ